MLSEFNTIIYDDYVSKYQIDKFVSDKNSEQRMNEIKLKQPSFSDVSTAKRFRMQKMQTGTATVTRLKLKLQLMGLMMTLRR